MHTNWAILSDDQFIRIGFKLNQYLHWLIEKWKQLNNDYIFSRGYYMMKFKLIIRYWMMFSVHGISIGALNSKKKPDQILTYLKLTLLISIEQR